MDNKTTKAQPTRSQIDVLMSDWLGNLRQSSDNFTHEGAGGIRLSKPTTTTEYLIPDVNGYDQVELMKVCRAAAENVVGVVMSRPATVSVGGQDSYQTEDRQGRPVINLATDYFDDARLSSRQKADIMLGLATHEAAHGAYTQPDLMMEMLEREPKGTVQLKKQVWNLIEDERIEYLACEDNPGYAANVGATKEYYFRRLRKDLEKGGQMPTEPLPKFLAALTQAVRYPSELSRSQAEECFDNLDAVRRILTPYPLDAREAVRATERIMDVIRDLAREQARKDKAQQAQQQAQQQGQGSPQQQQQSAGSGAGASGQPQGGPQDSDGTGDTSAGKKNSRGGKASGEPTKKEIDEALSRMLSTEEGKKVMDAMRRDNDKADVANKSKLLDGNNLQYINEEDAERMDGGHEFIFKPKGDQNAYQQALAAVRCYVPAMARALSCKSLESEYELHGLPSGKLNTNKLALLQCGNKNIFDKRGTVSCSSASVIMLIDESGSMSGARMYAAREAAVLINESLLRIRNVNFYCYGYTTRRMNVYCENGRTARWALGSTAALAGTPTGQAMRLAAERVRSFTQDPCLMLVVTDGSPDNSEEVVRQVGELPRQRIQPIGIGIHSNCIQRLFKESVTVPGDISSLAFDLGQLTRGRLDKMLVRKDSLQ